ncbi:MAG: DNA double-strand break repair nuclease NurA [Candidatus Micrarchaeota archaeon]
MYERIAEIARDIATFEQEKKCLAEELRKKDDGVFHDALERNLVRKVKTKGVNATVGAVDGGLLAQEFHGIDLVLARAVAVLFEYKDSKLVSHRYHPGPIVSPDVDALSYLETHEFMWYKSLFRLKKELDIATEAIEKFKPEYMFLDGSIVPQISDKPSEDSEIRGLYDDIIKRYKELYKCADISGCCLVGIIKDSRGKRFIEILRKHLEEGQLGRTHDTGFLNFLLRSGERTFTFRYSSSVKEHQVLKDLNDWSSRVDAFYLKAIEGDRPLRVEFIEGEKSFDEIASIVFDLSRISKNYAYPAVLIEADMRAALDRGELDRVYGELVAKTGLRSSTMKLRRDSRPFR